MHRELKYYQQIIIYTPLFLHILVHPSRAEAQTVVFSKTPRTEQLEN